jgi:hypothetical protein
MTGHYGLTPGARADRDTQICRLSADGVTVAKIADDLGCTTRTVYSVRKAARSDASATYSAATVESVDLTEMDLHELAVVANRHHTNAETAIGTAVQYARRSGEALCAAKRQVRHGEWAIWLAAHFHGSARTAQAYMQLAASNPQSSADLDGASINAALKALRPKSKPKPSGTVTPIRPGIAPPTSPAQAQCVACGDIYPIATLYKDAHGYECERCVDPDGDAGFAAVEFLDGPAEHLAGVDDLRALVRDVACSVTYAIPTDELAQRVADKTPQHELRGLYRAALHFAIDIILEQDLDTAMDAVFGSPPKQHTSPGPRGGKTDAPERTG